MATNIKAGDKVTLSHLNGLGTGVFTVLEVHPKDLIHQLHVVGRNGQTWWARSEGAKVVAR